MLQTITGCAVIIMALTAIGIMIYSGCMVAINSARNEARRTVEIRAKRLADRMYRDRLANTVIRVSQKMVVVEDDLGGTYQSET